MNPQLRPLNSDANLDIFWPHFVCNSSACTSWLWIGIRYLSNWNKFKHLMWNIKFYKYSYSHSISTDYLFRGRNKDIFFSGKHKETKAKLNWIICQWIIRVCFREGPKVHFSQLSEADQAFCLQTQKPYTTDQGLWTPNEAINQRCLKNWVDVADKLCFGRT